MTQYATMNGVKPRFDNGGSEFGLMHRDIGPGFLMFDIDRASAVIEINLELRRENEAFLEYRHGPGIRFVALFEVKNEKTEYSLDALDNTKSSTMARNEMAKLLGCRLFVVYATKGKQPFEFYEYDKNKNIYELVGILQYEPNSREQAVKHFWNNVLNIKR